MSIPATDRQAIARGAEDGEALWILGGLYTFKGVNAETGAYLACEVKARDGYAIPVHHHDDEEEGFYVAQGEATIFLGEQQHRLGTGGFALAPRGVSHAFRLERADTTLLVLVSPGPKHEALFRAIGEPAVERVVPPMPTALPDPAEFGAIAARYGTRIVGLPPTR
jgi:quercetin dioxygenase-like cupin family protein